MIKKILVFLYYLSYPSIRLSEHSNLESLTLYMKGALKVTKDLSNRLLASKWFVHNWFINFDNLFETIVHYLIIEKMISLGHQNGLPISSILMCMVTY